MKFKNPLHQGIFQKRYKRFFADVRLGDEIIVAHTANTGTMKSCLQEGWPALLSFHDSPTRKLKYSLEMISNGNTWIGINTSLTNSLAIEAIQNGVIKELLGYRDLKPEVKIGHSRIDILLSNSPSDQCFVEVKNVTLLNDDGNCTFPDAVTERGQKHLAELLELKKKGVRTVLLFVVQREDAIAFKLEQSIDPLYCKMLVEAIQGGVEVLAYQCRLTPEEITIQRKMQLIK